MSDGVTHLEDETMARVVPMVFDHGLILPTGRALRVAIDGGTPNAIEIAFCPLTEAKQPMVGPVSTTTGLKNVMLAIGQPIFLMFFERYNVWLTANLGLVTNWPMTLNFARLVRNAIAHGGIKINNPNSPPVTWKTLSYSHADNGRKIIGLDLGLGDLIGLMIEANEELDILGAPAL